MITEIWLGVPITESAQRQRLDQGYELTSHQAHHRGRYVMAHRKAPELRPHTKWTPDRYDRLRALVLQGLTNREIGDRMGHQANTIAARIHRMGGRARMRWDADGP